MDSEQLFIVAIIVAIITIGLSISFDTYMDSKVIQNNLNRGCLIEFSTRQNVKKIDCTGKGIENVIKNSK